MNVTLYEVVKLMLLFCSNRLRNYSAEPQDGLLCRLAAISLSFLQSHLFLLGVSDRLVSKSVGFALLLKAFKDVVYKLIY